jgi:hypothetical protein
LSPTTVRHSRSDSNSSSIHHLDGDSLQRRLSGLLRDHCVKSQCHDKEFLPISDIERILSRDVVYNLLAQLEELKGLSSEELD